jgi:hypothetical protein
VARSAASDIAELCAVAPTWKQEAFVKAPRSMRSAISQAVGQKGKATNRRRPKDVTHSTELTTAQRSGRRAAMRQKAKLMGLSPPTDADYEAAGIGLRPYDYDWRAAQAKQRATKAAKAQAPLRLCSLCGLDLGNQRDPNWRCQISRCIGPFTKSELEQRPG